ncbi:hypothetical protein JTB14_022646 [Gonioctena quinquepunctata]|nr:hypothetical protein JTB14_022646 [Gonioctena quinquepunctata]
MSLNDSAVTKIIVELNETKEELKNSIKASEDRLKLSMEELKQKINYLEAENLTLKNKLEVVERKNKSNNLVIFGFDKDPAEISPQIVINELNKLLEVKKTEKYWCIHCTLTTIQQEELKVLKRHLEKMRKLNSDKKSFIKGNRLVTEAATFTVQELLSEKRRNRRSTGLYKKHYP